MLSTARQSTQDTGYLASIALLSPAQPSWNAMNNNDGSDKTLNTEKPVNIDPRWFVAKKSQILTTGLTPNSIQEALRMYFQPIKNEDPQLDFYTIYKREATEYDTEYMKKYNEDLNTTLIFVRF